ncbi:MAG: DNA gyrase subunit A [Bryobacterales bacterium]|nr:DNA gyrase subunit A [Bryobacterales bacterium]
MADPQDPTTPPPGGPPGGQIPLGGDGGNKSHIPINIEDEMRRSYLDYAMSVIVGRALPDVRDGLKPVHRRILFQMHEMGLHHNRPTKKSARVVGDVMGKLHPHGDASIYDALVRMAQPFSMRYPPIDGQGNFGSVDGDPPAAMRYTEARLARIAASMLEDIDKETVDFKPNYDESESEPEVLPTRIPNLLVNGSEGIAVGMASKIPPHNLREIVEACIALVQNPAIQLPKIIEMVQGPDFPTGGIILGREGIYDYFKNGRGSIKVRARAATEKIGKDREAIIVTELPYQVNKARLIETTAGLVNEKRIEGISEIRDESDRDGMRIVFELKRGEQAEVILNNLYKHTQMQVNFGVILLAIVNGQPRELGILDALKRFIEHRMDVIRRRTDYLLRKARDREHILLGFQRTLTNLDAVIALIRASKTPREAREALMNFITPAEATECAKAINAGELGPRFSEKQAQAIIELQLQRLTGMEQQKILDELAEIQRMIAEYLEILGSEPALRKVVVKELKEVQKDFGDERRTEIIEDTGEIRLEDLVQVEDVAVTVTRGGYLKRTAVDTYRRQTRGGKGRIGMSTRAEDVVEHLIVASTHAYLLIFTNKGRVYWLKIYNIPDASTTGKGKHSSGLINLQPDESVTAFLPVKEFVADQFIIMVTKQGVIKKCELTEFDNPLQRGIIALGIDEGDELLAARLTSGNNYIFLGSHEGMACRFKESDVRSMGRPARGVRGMELEEGDYLVGVEVVEEEGLILSISENGFGKRTPLKDYRLTARGRKGVINMKTTTRVGKVVGILSVREDSDLMIITKQGQIIRIESGKIRQAGRSTQGVKLVDVEAGDQVAAASLIPDTEAQDELPLQ